MADPTKSAAALVNLHPPGAITGTATFVALDTVTQGNWKSVYGANGYNVINDAAAYPNGVTVTPWVKALIPGRLRPQMCGR